MNRRFSPSSDVREDWIQDAARERHRKRQLMRERRKKRRNSGNLRRLLSHMFNVGQHYIVIVLVGTFSFIFLPPLELTMDCPFGGVKQGLRLDSTLRVST